jgi:hypothetical protein
MHVVIEGHSLEGTIERLKEVCVMEKCDEEGHWEMS